MTKFLGNDIVWRTILSVLILILIGLGSWVLIEVSTLPKNYVTMSVFNEKKLEISQQICDLREELNSKVESIKSDMKSGQDILRERMVLNQNKLENKIDHLSDLMITYIAKHPIKKSK